MVDNPIPNLFLVGVPKACTTAMYSYLRAHPEIYMSPLKEPQFFAEDVLGAQRNVTTLEEYRRCFRDAGNRPVIGEASTAYMVSRTAAREIRQYSPNARILVMLRNPVDVMHALHSKRVFMHMEHITDFEAAIDSSATRTWQSGRWKGQAIARRPYREVAEFSPQLRRYFDVFGREGVHVVLYDDFRSNPAATYRDVLAFLGVSCDQECYFGAHNANRRVRSMSVQEWLRDPFPVFRRMAHTLLPDQVRRSVGRAVRALNVRYEPRKALAPDLRRRLRQECARDVETLGELLGRDLWHWTEVGRETRSKSENSPTAA
jgi:hypothetical protein